MVHQSSGVAARGRSLVQSPCGYKRRRVQTVVMLAPRSSLPPVFEFCTCECFGGNEDLGMRFSLLHMHARTHASAHTHLAKAGMILDTR